ncbi:hypothetical protein NDN08_000972 [Rhodosorus marinus]|uniref:Calcineurin-like phosphoesterase domain-containing protein n=1 Tax=Rhodosorus marinus TaxID=101924 RepID=A0AAV8UPI7_9RHOD|nr:hypothetical protein NDN08_000972 [Rhodosorus marinus]
MENLWLRWLPVFYISGFALPFLLYGGQRDVRWWSSTNKFATDETFLDSETVNGWGDDSGKLVTIIQITDTHMNFFDGGMAAEKFQYCLKNVIPVVNPDAVVVTGDLTNSKHYNTFPFLGKFSEQRPEEWELYNNLTRKTRASLWWMEIPGNHDNFGNGERNGPGDFYHRQIWASPQRVSSINIRKPFGTYRLLTIDATLEMGPHRPFNFFGHATEDLIREFRDTITRDSDYPVAATLLFGHFPSSTMLFDDSRRRGFIQSVQDLASISAYMSGHLHSIFNLLPNGLRSLSRDGRSLELETPDLWTSSSFRMIVFDHNRLAEHVHKIGQWPIVVVTNPTPALSTSVPGSAAAAARSSHIRVLLYRDRKLTRPTTQLKVEIDGQVAGHTDGLEGLNLVAWDPDTYSSGVHNLEVFVDGADEACVSFDFSLDGSSRFPRFSLLSTALYVVEILLSRTDFPRLLEKLIILGILGCIVILVYTRYSPSYTARWPALRRSVWWSLFAYLGWLLLGWFYVIPGLVPGIQARYAFVGVLGTRTGDHKISSSDANISLALFVWFTLVPMVTGSVVSTRYQSVRRRILFVGPLWVVFLTRMAGTILDMSGAYGPTVALLSPCLAPTAFLGVYSMRTLWNPSDVSESFRPNGEAKVEKST